MNNEQHDIDSYFECKQQVAYFQVQLKHAVIHLFTVNKPTYPLTYLYISIY